MGGAGLASAVEVNPQVEVNPWKHIEVNPWKSIEVNPW